MKNDRQKNIILLIIPILFILVALVCSKTAPRRHTRIFTDYFDTVTEITVISRNEKPIKACEKYMKKMDSELSATSENGLIHKYNNGESPDFSADTKELIDYSVSFTAENGDFFSVYLNPLIDAWDIKNNSGTIPDVDAALGECEKQNTLNLGGIAKGFVTEKLVKILEENNVSSALINLGGNTYAMGKKETGENWKIGIKDPKSDGEIGIITAENIAVITSGDYERYFELNNIRYHHIFDPKTGYPSNNGLHSVTVISKNPTLCDALSTAAFVAGLDKGISLLKKYNCYGIFITDDTVYFSKDIEDIFKQTDFSYKYEFIY